MAKRGRKAQKVQADPNELALLTIVQDLEQAEEIESLLQSNGIPAAVSRQHSSEETDGGRIAVMVPEEYLDEAGVVVESNNVYDDFCDLSFDDEGDIDFDNDYFEEDI